MTDDRRVCAACGNLDYDVSSQLIELPEPWEVVEGRTVRFRIELRCVDHEACEERRTESAVGA